MSRYTAEQQADHARDLRKHEPSGRHQKKAVIELVGFIHGLSAKETLGEFVGAELIRRTNRVCAEFDIERLPIKRTEPADA